MLKHIHNRIIFLKKKGPTHIRIMQEIYLSFKKYIYLEGDFAIDVQTDIHRFLFY